MRGLFEMIAARSSLPLLLALCLLSAGTMYLLFNPGSPWFEVTEAVPFAAPETLPGFATEPVFQFLSAMTPEQRVTYLIMHVYDIAYFVTLGAALLVLFGLAIQRMRWGTSPLVWLLAVPLLLVLFESLESVALVSAMLLLPARVEPVLWLAEVATAGKMASYLTALPLFVLALLTLLLSFLVNRR